MISLILAVLCLGVSIFMGVKHERLVGETRQAKQDFLKAKTTYLKVEDQYQEVCSTLKDTFLVVNDYRKELNGLKSTVENLSQTVQKQGKIIEEQQVAIETLQGENARIKKHLGFYEDLAPHCKLVEPVIRKL